MIELPARLVFLCAVCGLVSKDPRCPSRPILYMIMLLWREFRLGFCLYDPALMITRREWCLVARARSQLQ